MKWMIIVVEYFGFVKEFIYLLMYVAAIESQFPEP